MMAPQTRNRSDEFRSMLAILYASVVVSVALQLYRLLMLMGSVHAHGLNLRSPKQEKVETYPQEALFGYDWYVWRFMLPFMWRADTALPSRLYEATIGRRTLEVGPGSAYFPRRSDAQLCYDLLDVNPVHLHYTHTRLERLWVQIAREIFQHRLVPSLPAPRRFSPDKEARGRYYQSRTARPCAGRQRRTPAVRYAHRQPRDPLHPLRAGYRPRQRGTDRAKIKMSAILTGMARLVTVGGSLIGCTVLGPRCNDWTHPSEASEAAAVQASAMLRRIKIFVNEYDSLDAFVYGAKTAALDIRMARVTGNLLTFHLVKS
ncbi:hypothetical protein EX895_005150 [Sporisorium graminicola]|uniref:Uncharacterized protein n=1 Tax=Sporisorium graminicola TaxID=280036 RepID=A0A4U7KPC7_9BASI|nr:hypothetical protein EX895_005150 [Sporisorium graminicola]TKY86325.1 hypothetical protein EX895_005150 [Sporisorium graminicola]